MSKRSYGQVETFVKKFRPTESYEQVESTAVLEKISFLLENISNRLDQCEKSIKFLTDCKIKEEQEKLAQKIKDEEIFRSYIN